MEENQGLIEEITKLRLKLSEANILLKKAKNKKKMIELREKGAGRGRSAPREQSREEATEDADDQGLPAETIQPPAATGMSKQEQFQ